MGIASDLQRKRRAQKVFQQKAFPPPRGTPPTQEQTRWLRDHKNFVRTSHLGHLAKFREQGTLHIDGSFVPVSPGRPIMDGGGAFGVGIPFSPRRRQR
jgi:hypothetical protein